MKENEDIFIYLKGIQKKIEADMTQYITFWPSENHITLGIDRKGLDPVPYKDYDPLQKKHLGRHDKLIPKICLLLEKINRKDLIPEVKKFFY